MALKDNMNRREFMVPAAASLAFSIVPRHVLGGTGYVPPSDKLTLAYIGCGTQGLREMFRLIANPDVQIVATCDPVKDATNYVDWDKTGLRDSVRKLLEKPNWGEGVNGIRCGRDVAKEIIETYYANKRSAENYKGCASYADFRELLEKEKDVDAVKIMTPDHLHATIAIAAMRKGKHVAMHKPLANRISEMRLVLETARQTGVQTHSMAWRAPIDSVKAMIQDGAIGTLREIHNWTDRPFWPQYAEIPTDRPPVPEGFDWDLWLGPALDRPYHPHYTHAVFRGWYDFGAGSVADMGTYSLWPIFMALDLPVPIEYEAQTTSACKITDGVSDIIVNDFSFPITNRVRMKFPSQGGKEMPVLYWYDGGMKPWTPEELAVDGKNIPATGFMFVGDKGIILNNSLIPEKKMAAYRTAKKLAEPAKPPRGASDPWVQAFKGGKGGKQSAGNFLNASNVSEAIAMAGVAMRITRKNFQEGTSTPPLKWDPKTMKVTNMPEANQYLVREYRDGWKLA